MARLKEINGRSVSEIMQLETRQVRAAGKIYTAKYDPLANTVYLMDDVGNLTGMTAVVKLPPAPAEVKDEPPAAISHMDRKPTSQKAESSKVTVEKSSKKEPRKDSQDNRKSSGKSKEEKDAERIARKSAKYSKKQSAEKTAKETRSSKKKKGGTRFHIGYFLAGMLVVLLAMVALYVVRFGVYEGFL